jgi:hypothetical protein
MSASRLEMVTLAANNIEAEGSRMTARAVVHEMLDLYPHSNNVPIATETAQLLRQCGFRSQGLTWDKRSRSSVMTYERRPK